ncbi:MAG: ABC transporter ATP-binding protein [Micrococcaceae bacterium]
MSEKNSKLLVKDLRKTFGTKVAIDGISLYVSAGEVVSLLGPNGAGKTTTIECTQGLKTYDSGSIKLLGVEPKNYSPELRARVGVMFQDSGLPVGLNPQQLLQHVSSLYENPRPIKELVDLLGIESFAKTNIRRLSGGQKQRIGLAAALIGRPEIVFLDEPTAGMDPQSRHVVWGIIEKLKSEGVAIILTTHHIDDAERLSDRVYIIDHGKIIAEGTPHELIGNSETANVSFEAPPTIDFTELELPYTISEKTAGFYRSDEPINLVQLSKLIQEFLLHGINATNISMQQRTLEDVFIDLTGRSIR